MWTFFLRSRHPWPPGLPTGLLVGFLVIVPVVGSWGAGPSNAWAQTTASSAVSQQRVRELEERVKILELEQEALDRRTRLQAERTGRAIEELEMRVRALEENGRASLDGPAIEPEKGAGADAVCKDPYVYLSNGIRRVKSGCENGAKPCDVPKVVDGRGFWTVRPECAPATPVKEGACDIPYFVGTTGIKEFKPECR